jgi:hypothetical protein
MLSANDLNDLKDDEELLEILLSLCQNDSFKVAKFAASCVMKISGVESAECKSLVRSSLAALDFNSKLSGIFAALSEVAKGAIKVFKAADQTTVINFAKKVLYQNWSGAGKKDKKMIINARCNAIKIFCSFILGSSCQDSKKDEKKIVDLINEIGQILAKSGEIGSDSMSDAEKSTLRLTAGSSILKISKVKELRELISPKIFLYVSLLCEDDDLIVRKAILGKIWKGAGIQQGRLPFHFAAMVVLGAHESDPAQLEFVKTVLKNILALMKKLRSNSGKLLMSIAPERILPWLVYFLANHPRYLDADEDDAQLSVSFKKYLELFLNTVTQSGTDEKIFPMLWQTLDHLRQCTVPDDALADDAVAVVARNMGIICEVGKRLVAKFGGQKKWDSEVLRDHLNKVVDSSIFVRHAAGAQLYTPTLPDATGTSSPPRKGGSTQSTPASSTQKSQRQAPARSPASRKRLRDVEAEAQELTSQTTAAERTMPKRATKTAMRRLQEESEDEEREETAAADTSTISQMSPVGPGRSKRQNPQVTTSSIVSIVLLRDFSRF